MIDEQRKAELVNDFAAYMERYLDKQWVDDEFKCQKQMMSLNF